ncbi:hypothetical protein BP6252_02428 [Coleophoma cylindrospora]|uniref:Fe2OG dioxygenase domain-containing protein n=1 Tax=Coleophoma cylindrospora TaxID=1849047 RepID=A0A3D8SGF3_9HELO|nr:hypothetical protein BP6252_02428 [Coleophoma cylindrospora]
MPSAAAEFEVPLVDIAPYIADPSSSAAQKVVEQVRNACMTSGFFSLTGHGVSEDLQNAVFDGAKKFFALPFSEKEKLDKKLSLGASNRGYEVLGGQALEEGKLPDLKEGFYAGQDIPADDPRTIAGRFYMGPNVWPAASLVPEADFKVPVTEYYHKMHSLSLLVMDILAQGLPYGPDVFREFVSNDAVAAIRILHYPPQTSEDKNQLGAGAHTDFGAITLLLQDGNPGLQVWNHNTESWLSIPPTQGAPFDGSEAEGGVITVEEHMNERFATTFGRGKEGVH